MPNHLLRMTNNASRELRHYDTIVIGAGMSGLACASRLFQDARYKNPGSLLVLEARKRLGGRIGSVKVDGCRLDTGANWIHGIGTKERPNPLMQILPHKRYRQLSGTVAFRPPSESHNGADVENDSVKQDDWVDLGENEAETSSHSQAATGAVIPAEIAGKMYGALWKMIGELHEMANKIPSPEAKHTKMLEAIHRTGVIEDAIKEVPSELHRAFRSMPAFIESMEAAPLAAQSAEHSQDIPGMGLLEFALGDFEGDQVFLQDGYIAIIEDVAKDLVDAGAIELGVEVLQIEWKSQPIVIKTNAGDYSADKVVCTLPLGILKNGISHQSAPTTKLPLFTPRLPSDKVEAISSLGFGTLDKIFLVYSHPWWEEEPYISTLKPGIVQRPFASEDVESHTDIPDSMMGFTNELPGIEINPDGTSSSGLRSLSLINLHRLTGFPVLSAFVSCSNANYIEALSDEKAGKLIQRSLESWFHHGVPAAKAVHVTRWAQDEFSRGSYSHMITGLSETRHREAFQERIVNNHNSELRFAGEHTSKDHFATVHGALLSGWREADDILR